MSLDEGPAPRHLARRPGQAQARVCRTRQRDGGQQLADQRRRGRPDPGQRKAVKQFGLTPLARFVSYAAAACRRRSWALARSRPSRLPCATRASSTGHRLVRAERGVSPRSRSRGQHPGPGPGEGQPMGGAIALGHPLGAYRCYPGRDTVVRPAWRTPAGASPPRAGHSE